MTIGGFLPLETATAAAPAACHHPGAVALASGRACWHAVLRDRRPERVLLPFYICDAVLQPLTALQVPFEFYALDESFRPAALPAPCGRGLALVVNYFGMQSSFVAGAAGRDPRIVVDDTQAFFRRGQPDRWSFNSARKFFGVPDGGFLYGPAGDLGDLPPSDIDDCAHLVTRLRGDDARAWELFRAHEARIGIDVRAMSRTSAGLLAAVDIDAACRRRVANFRALHEALGPANTIRLPLDLGDDDVPMCYPFLPAREVDRAAVARAGAFVPMFWPEVAARTDGGFAWERAIAGRLLPLPIDHRYTASHMAALAGMLLQVLS